MTDMNEKHLSRAVRDYLNRMARENKLKSIVGTVKFEFIDRFVDVADEKRKIYIEVKTDHLAFAQLLYAVALEGIRDAYLIGVADRARVKLYKPPPFTKMVSLTKRFDPTKVFTPSQVDKPELNERAEKLLGKPEEVIPLRLEGEGPTFITVDILKEMWDEKHTKPLSRYRINPAYLVCVTGLDKQVTLAPLTATMRTHNGLVCRSSLPRSDVPFCYRKHHQNNQSREEVHSRLFVLSERNTGYNNCSNYYHGYCED